MKDIYELLREKEAEIHRVRHQIDSLQLVASLLSEDIPSNDAIANKKVSAKRELDVDDDPQGTDDLFSSITTSRSNFWEILKRTK